MMAHCSIIGYWTIFVNSDHSFPRWYYLWELKVLIFLCKYIIVLELMYTAWPGEMCCAKKGKNFVFIYRSDTKSQASHHVHCHVWTGLLVHTDKVNKFCVQNGFKSYFGCYIGVTTSLSQYVSILYLEPYKYHSISCATYYSIAQLKAQHRHSKCLARTQPSSHPLSTPLTRNHRSNGLWNIFCF